MSRKDVGFVCKICLHKNLDNATDLIDVYFLHYANNDSKLRRLYARLNSEMKIVMADYLQHLITTNQIYWNWGYLGYDDDFDGSIWNL